MNFLKTVLGVRLALSGALGILFLAFTSVLAAQGADDVFGTPVIVPMRRAVGDLVEVRFPFEPGSPAFNPASVSLEGPIRTDAYDILSVSIEGTLKIAECVVRFIAWTPGDIHFKAIPASSLVVPAFMVSVESVTAVYGSGPVELRPPLPLPGTAVWIALFGAALVLALMGVAALLFRSSPLARAMAQRRLRRRAFRDLLRLLARLEQGKPGVDVSDRKSDRKRWDILSSGFRTYLASRCDFPVQALTGSQIAGLPFDAFAHDVRSVASALLCLSDAVRFGGQSSRIDEAIRKVRESSIILEEADRHVVR